MKISCECLLLREIYKNHYENLAIQCTDFFFQKQKNENFFGKKNDCFNIFAQNIDCVNTLEPPRRGG